MYGNIVEERSFGGGCEELVGLRKEDGGCLGGPVPHEYTLHPVQGDATGHVDCSIDGIQGPGASFGYRIGGGFLGDDRILGECGADCSDDLPLDRHIDIGHRVVDAGDGVLPADPSDVSDEGPRIDEGFAQNLQLLRHVRIGVGMREDV